MSRAVAPVTVFRDRRRRGAAPLWELGYLQLVGGEYWPTADRALATHVHALIGGETAEPLFLAAPQPDSFVAEPDGPADGGTSTLSATTSAGPGALFVAAPQPSEFVAAAADPAPEPPPEPGRIEVVPIGTDTGGVQMRRYGASYLIVGG